MILVSIESYDKRLLDLKIPRSGNFGPKMGKSGNFFKEGQEVKIFLKCHFQHLCITIMGILITFERK